MAEATLAPLDAAPSSWQMLRQHWAYRFILFPLGQIFFFVVAVAVVLSVFSLLLSLIIPPTTTKFTTTELIVRQLPGTIVGGIGIGFVYAMIALGYTLVYGVLKFINFAHSEIFMVGGVVAFEITTRIEESGAMESWNPVLLLIVVIAGSMIFSGLLAMLIERLAYRPLRNAPRLVPLITAIGVSFILIDVVRAIMSLLRNRFELTYPKLQFLSDITMRFEVGESNVTIRGTTIIIVIVSILMLMALNYFVNGTKWGRGIRAISQDQAMAGLLGVNVNLLIGLTFFLGGAFGGAAGALYGLNIGKINATSGFIPGLTAFTAAVLGGIGNLTGALLGGITLGMLESFLNGILVYIPFLGINYTPIFTFSVLIIILIFRPAGLLGEKVDEKV